MHLVTTVKDKPFTPVKGSDYDYRLYIDVENTIEQFNLKEGRLHEMNSFIQERHNLRLAIGKLNETMAREGVMPHHQTHLVTLESQVSHLSVDVMNRSIILEEIERRLFHSAKSMINHYVYLNDDFLNDYISNEDHLKYLRMLQRGIPYCVGIPSLAIQCLQIQKDIDSYLPAVEVEAIIKN